MDKNSMDISFHFDPADLLVGQSIDCVIFGYNTQGLNILVSKLKNLDIWSLLGGFILKDEDMDDAAVRILEERTGLKLPYLKQFHTFGDASRQNISHLQDKLGSFHITETEMIRWLKQRFISTGYLSLVNMEESTPTPDFLSDRCSWIPLSDLPDLVYDHRAIIDKALEFLRNQINYMPIGLSLLPERFTMKELQHLYESILSRSLDRSNFQKKMLKLGFLERLEKKQGGGAHKAPYLYSFHKEKYDQLLKQGMGFL